MKKLLLLACLCLLLAGCNPRSRQPSENFVPSDWAATPQQGQNPAGTGSPADGSGTGWNGPSGGIVKQVFFEEGDYTCDGTTLHYSYAIPMVDLPSDYAMGVNQEIELRFGNLIRDSLENKERLEPMDVQTVRYSEDVYGSVLTVRIYQTDADGGESQGVYSLNAVTGDAPTSEEFLAAAGLQEKQVSDLLAEAIAVRIRELVGNRYRDPDPRYSAAVTRTQEQASNPNLLHMHLTEDGRLAVYVTVYLPDNSTDLQEFILP